MKKSIKLLNKLIHEIGILNVVLYVVFLVAVYLLVSLQPIFLNNIVYSHKLKWVYILLLIFSMLITPIANFYNNFMLQKTRNYSKKIVFEDLSKKRYFDFVKGNFGEIQNLIQEISFSCRVIQNDGLKNIIKNIIIIVTYTIILSKINNILGLIYVISYIIYVYISIKFLKKDSKNIENALNSSSKINSFMLDFFVNYDTIYNLKTFNIENSKFTKLLDDEERNYKKVQNKIDYSNLKIQLILILFSTVLILYYEFVSANTEYKFFLILIYSIFYLGNFGKEILLFFETLDRLKISLEKLNVFDNAKTYKIKTLNLNNNEIINVKDLSFRYNDFEPYIFSNLSFTINKSDKVLILGENGAGKSTLCKIIANMLVPGSGEIVFNKKFINDEKDISYYSQNNSLFDASIFENIVYNINDYDINLIKTLIKELKLDNLIKTDDDLFNKKAGDFGKIFSHGEKQKILIIRSFLKPNEIIIYDEINSALDKETTTIFYNLLNKYCANSTIIFISHRNNYENVFNKIIKI